MAKDEEELFVNTDGGARGNPGPAAWGVVIKDSAGKPLELCGNYIGITTNNIAEYQAVLEAFQKVSQLVENRGEKTKLFFNLDSQLVVNQLKGTFKVKNQALKDYVDKIKGMEKNYLQVSYNYIPREKNFEADRLVNKALDERTS